MIDPLDDFVRTAAHAAAIVGISESAARSRYHRARAGLRVRLHEHHYERSIG